MKTIIGVILISFILIADSPKHNFAFTVNVECTLEQAADLEKEITKLVEDFENKFVKVEMNTVKIETDSWKGFSPYILTPKLKGYPNLDSLGENKFIIPRSGDWIYIDTKY